MNTSTNNLNDRSTIWIKFLGTPREYLEHYVFPWLLPALEDMLRQAKKEKCLEVIKKDVIPFFIIYQNGADVLCFKKMNKTYYYWFSNNNLQFFY